MATKACRQGKPTQVTTSLGSLALLAALRLHRPTAGPSDVPVPASSHSELLTTHTFGARANQEETAQSMAVPSATRVAASHLSMTRWSGTHVL